MDVWICRCFSVFSADGITSCSWPCTEVLETIPAPLTVALHLLVFCFHCLEGMCAYWTCCTALRCDDIYKYWARPWNLSFHTCAGTLWQLCSARLKMLSAWNHYKLITDSQIRKTETTAEDTALPLASPPQWHWEDKPTGRGTEACALLMWSLTLTRRAQSDLHASARESFLAS